MTPQPLGSHALPAPAASAGRPSRARFVHLLHCRRTRGAMSRSFALTTSTLNVSGSKHRGHDHDAKEATI